MNVAMTPEAASQFTALPGTVKARVAVVLGRLAAWPVVSGAKPMRGDLKGHFRVRTGDWRVLFQVHSDRVLVVRIAHRKEVYDE